jgi:hypothetical protein
VRRVCLIFAASLGYLTHWSSAQDLSAPGVAYVDTVRVTAELTVAVRPFLIEATVTVRLLEGEAPTAIHVSAVRGIIRLSGGDVSAGILAVVAYRALPLDLRTEFRLQRVPYEVPARSRIPTRRTDPAPPTPTTLRSTGSISRGVIAGSNRDVAVESGLRLELNGELAPGVGIRASLTDADTPIRPDGTTQRLSEFDRVFIELSASPGRVLLGDFDGRLDGSHFATLSRKLQGVFVDGSVGRRVSIKAAGATSRGQFRSQSITALDGNQGPYRLEGASGERFILVLPGSEKVYVDGKLLVRGETEDYTIDYATGDLRFTPQTVVTSDLRILIEFQYSTNQFTRTLLASQFDAPIVLDRAGRSRWSIGGTVIREADSGQFLSEFGLTSADSLLLASSGDQAATRSGATQVLYDPEARFTHYVVESKGADSIFVALSSRPPPGTRVYRVQFSRVGEGRGAYVRDAESVNGITYAHRGPGQGDYEPLRLLPSPVSRSLIDLRTRFEPVEGFNLEGEWARSTTDLNRLSNLDSGDDGGEAGRIGWSVRPVSLGILGRVGVQGSVRQSSRNFRTFERYRPVEFAREWNLTGIAIDPTGTVEGADRERESELGLEWLIADSVRTTATVSSLRLPGVFDGDRMRAAFAMKEKRLPGIGLESIRVRSNDLRRAVEGSWNHDLLSIERARGAWRTFGELEVEKRLEGVNDSLGATSIRYSEFRPGMAFTGETASASFQIERRMESRPIDGTLVRSADSWTIRTGGELTKGESFRADVDLAWRKRAVTETYGGTTGASDSQALLVTMNAAGRIRRVSVDWLYDARTEQTPVLQEIYLRAGPELGAYVWVDENGDDVVQLDELLPETTPNEGNYIRTYLPSDSLTSVNAVRARLALRLRPNSGGGRFLSRVSGQTVLEVEERSRTGRRADIYLLRLDRFRRPGETTSGRVRVRQDLRLFQTERGFRLDLSFQENRSLSELATGVETRTNRATEVVTGFRFSGRGSASLRVARTQDHKSSERFESRRFRIDSWRLVPGVVLRRGSHITLRLSVELATKVEGTAARRARLLRVPATVRYARAGRLDVVGRLEFASVALSGARATGLAEFELTDGRGPGNSSLWGLTAQWALSTSLRATISYDGRAPSSGRIVHAGRVQMTALF